MSDTSSRSRRDKRRNIDRGGRHREDRPDMREAIETLQRATRLMDRCLQHGARRGHGSTDRRQSPRRPKRSRSRRGRRRRGSHARSARNADSRGGSPRRERTRRSDLAQHPHESERRRERKPPNSDTMATVSRGSVQTHYNRVAK